MTDQLDIKQGWDDLMPLARTGKKMLIYIDYAGIPRLMSTNCSLLHFAGFHYRETALYRHFSKVDTIQWPEDHAIYEVTFDYFANDVSGLWEILSVSKIEKMTDLGYEEVS